MAPTVRPARPEDVSDVLAMVRELAEYERSAHLVDMTEDDLRGALFGGTVAGVAARSMDDAPALYCLVVADHDGLYGFAIYFVNFSTWTGRHGIYLEDLYVRPEARGHGYGKAILGALAAVCSDRGFARLEWWVLDWNQPAIDFYRSIGAVGMDEWTVNRVDGDALAALAVSPPALIPRHG